MSPGHSRPRGSNFHLRAYDVRFQPNSMISSSAPFNCNFAGLKKKQLHSFLIHVSLGFRSKGVLKHLGLKLKSALPYTEIEPEDLTWIHKDHRPLEGGLGWAPFYLGNRTVSILSVEVAGLLFSSGL